MSEDDELKRALAMMNRPKEFDFFSSFVQLARATESSSIAIEHIKENLDRIEDRMLSKDDVTDIVERISLYSLNNHYHKCKEEREVEAKENEKLNLKKFIKVVTIIAAAGTGMGFIFKLILDNVTKLPI